MSTKSTVYDDYYINIYEETSEPQSIFGKFTGWNVYVIIDQQVFKSFKVKDDHLIIKTTHKGFEEITFWGGHVVEAEVDEGGIYIVLEGGTYHTKKFIEGMSVKELELNS